MAKRGEKKKNKQKKNRNTRFGRPRGGRQRNKHTPLRINQHLAKLTETGRLFLQASIASRDFPGVKAPVPDASVGATVVIRSRMTQTFTAGAAGTNFTACLLPTPGVATWTAFNVPGAGTIFGGNKYGDFSSLFGSAAGGNNVLANVDAFRYVSKTFEIKPVSATLYNAGLIIAARVPSVQMTGSIAGAAPQAPVMALSGLIRCTPQNLSSMPAVYQGHINQGVYGFAIQGQPNWPWTPLMVDVDGTNINYAETPSAAALNVTDAPGGVPEFVGYGTMSPIIVSISGLAAATSFAITTEDVIEYRPAPGSLLSEMATPGVAFRDQLALDMYEVAAQGMQPFCAADMNDGFWDKFLELVAASAGAVAPFSGQYAPFVGAVGGIATGLRSMNL